ncbi:MAG: thiamine phosphate synthase [Candidatus Omnitrophota bacterium]
MKSISWNKKLSSSGLLYVILDKKIIDEANKDIFYLADKLSFYGTDILQLRAKELNDKEFFSLAEKLAKIIHKRKKTFIVNDRADIALLSGADGLHLGNDDLAPVQARKILKKRMILGKTIHSFSELKKVENEKVNYLGFGPVFETKIKPELAPLSSQTLNSMVKKSKKLIFAIGGINLYNVSSLFIQGINNIAVCRGVILEENLKQTVKNYKKCLQKAF